MAIQTAGLRTFPERCSGLLAGVEFGKEGNPMSAGESSTPMELVGRWEDLVSRPEFRGHQVKITIVDRPSPAEEEKSDEWLESLQRMVDSGVRIARPADDSRESIY